MQLVETTVRPARLAVVVSTAASSQTLRRAFRLVGGRWGGMYDLLVRVEVGAELHRFYRGALIAADPDLVVSIDPALRRHPLADQVAHLGIQPFDVAHVSANAIGDRWPGVT